MSKQSNPQHPDQQSANQQAKQRQEAAEFIGGITGALKDEQPEVLQTYKRMMTIVQIGTPSSVYASGNVFMSDETGTVTGGWTIVRCRSFPAGIRITNKQGYVDVPWSNVACLWG